MNTRTPRILFVSTLALLAGAARAAQPIPPNVSAPSPGNGGRSLSASGAIVRDGLPVERPGKPQNLPPAPDPTPTTTAAATAQNETAKELVQELRTEQAIESGGDGASPVVLIVGGVALAGLGFFGWRAWSAKADESLRELGLTPKG